MQPAPPIDWKTASVEYRLETHSNLRFIALVFGSLIAAGFTFLILFLFMAYVNSAMTDAFAWIGTFLVLGTPFAVYFGFRKWMRSPVLVRLSPGKFEIRRNNKTTILPTDMIKSYESGNELAEEDTESVFIRDKQGKMIKITASRLSGNLRDVGSFRHDFDQWAEVHQLTRWSPWYRLKPAKG